MLAPATWRPGPDLADGTRSRDGAEDWLFVAVRCTPAHELEILLDHLPALIRALPTLVDRWFFVRYRHPHPHLRLRFHVAAADRIELSRQVDRAVVLAANHVDLLYGLRDPALAADEPDWVSRLEWPGPSDADRRGRKALTRAAVAAIDPFAVHDQIRAGLGDTVAEAWHRRAPAVAAYGRELHRSDGVGVADIARRAVLHMSANRLLGPDRDAEALSYALARTAIRTRTGRRRHTGTGRPADARRADPAPHRTKDGPHG